MKKKLFAIFLFIELIGVSIGIYDWWYSRWGFQGKLTRQDVGAGTYTETMEVTSGIYDGEVEIEVKEQSLSEKEAEALLKKAIEEIDVTFLGKNSDLEHIQGPVEMRGKYQKGLVKARWSLDSYEFVDAEGNLEYEKIQEPSIVSASVELGYQDYQSIYDFSFRVLPVEQDSPQGIMLGIKSAIEQQSCQDENVVLPQTVNGTKLRWKKRGQNRGLAISLLGFLCLLLLPRVRKVEEKKQVEKRQKEAQWDYASIVGQLSLLLRVGISLPEAVDRICGRYQIQECCASRTGYELLSCLNREIKDGVGEQKALENLANRSGLKEYKKLSLFLQQKNKRGNDELSLWLEQENVLAFEGRKNMAKRLGEEASTKLLFPLVGMLGVVMIILLTPALMTMRGIG